MQLNFPVHLTGIRNLTKQNIEDIFRETSYYKKFIFSKKPFERILDGRSVINLFFEDSTRTRTSFELAEKKLGMDSINFFTGSSSINKGESFLDTIKNIDAMKFDYIVIRHSGSGIPELLVNHTSARIINAGDGINEHPTQALLDMFTLKEKFGSLKNLKVCLVGDISHSRVAMSNIFGLRKFDAIVSVCGPASFIPRYIEGLGVNVYSDINDAIRDNDVVNVLRVQLEREAGSLLPSLNEFNRHYGITHDRLKYNRSIKILHPGPMNVNVEIDYETSDSPNSFIFEQVTNGVAVKCAIFKLMNEAK